MSSITRTGAFNWGNGTSPAMNPGVLDQLANQGTQNQGQAGAAPASPPSSQENQNG